MAKITQSLLKNSDSIGGIQGTISSFGKSLRAANNTSSVIIREFTKSNRSKKRAMLQQREIFGKRRAAVQRREQEDLIESSKVGGIFRRSAKVIGSSTKGFLGRVMDFVGTILVGWMVTNLPIIIENVQKLIGRIQKTVGALTGWYDGITRFFAGFTGDLDSADERILRQADFSQDQKSADESKEKILEGVDDVEKDYNKMIDAVNKFNIYALLGIEEREKEEPGTDDKQPGPFRRFFGGLTDFVTGDRTDFDRQGSYPSGGKLSPKQIADVARRAGIPEDMIPTMVAIALAESGGDSGAHNPKYPDNSYGLWQINMLDEPGYMLGAERRKKYGLSSNDQLKDPLTNAKAAYDILKSQGLGAWSVYSSGTYKQYLPAAKKAAAGARSSQPVVSRRVDSSTRYRKGQDVTQLLGGQTSAVITSRRGDFESFRSSPHKGIDIGCAAGLFISLAADAIVDGSTFDRGYGNVVDLYVPSYNVHLRFAHNSRILIGGRGARVPAGTSFAITGSTGRSTAPHIHLEANSTEWTSGVSNMSPAPYVSLIRLTKANVQGQKTSLSESSRGTGGPSLQIDGAVSRSMVASAVTPERRGSVITVPIPSESGQQPLPEGGSGGGGKGGGASEEISLNSFINKILLRDLEYV